MTQNTVIWSVETPFCRSFSQSCCTRDFAATHSTGLSDLLFARGPAHSHHITDLFLVSFSARGLAHSITACVAARCALLLPVCGDLYLFSVAQQHPVSVSVGWWDLFFGQ